MRAATSVCDTARFQALHQDRDREPLQRACSASAAQCHLTEPRKKQKLVHTRKGV